MRVLSIDPAKCTGWAIIDVDKSTSRPTLFLIDYGVFVIDTSSDIVGHHLIDMMRNIKDLTLRFDVDQICFEDYFMSKRAKTGANLNVYFRGAIQIVATQLDLPYQIVNIYSWKKHLHGFSKVPKDVKKKYRASANKIVTVIAFYEKHSLKFPNKWPNAMGKMNIFKYDIADAVAIGLYFCFIEHLQSCAYDLVECTDYFDRYNDRSCAPLVEMYTS